MYKPFKVAHRHLKQYNLEQRHLGKWGIENSENSCILFENELDANLMYNHMTLMPISLLNLG
ncbi:hypothetical protein DZF79_04705 [Vibrio parahaemolyticus]|nr:hypothetical protein [Vibrio parahaemolyticus]